MQLSAVDFLVMFAEIPARPFDFSRCLGQTWNDVVHSNGVAILPGLHRQPARPPMLIPFDIGNGLDRMRREFVPLDDFQVGVERTLANRVTYCRIELFGVLDSRLAGREALIGEHRLEAVSLHKPFCHLRR